LFGLKRDVYLSIVKFLDSSILRKVWVNVFFFLFFIRVFCSILPLVKNHTHEWNTFTSWFIDWKVFLFFAVIIYFICLLIHFIIIYFYSEIEFIKPLDDVKIQRTTITFTKDRCSCTVFINKMINSGIMRMFIFL
jgi:hypothetical protein